MLRMHRSRFVRSSDASSWRRLAANAPNSWPSVIGTASCSCVRPIFTMCANDFAFASITATRSFTAVTSDSLPSAIASFNALG